MKSWQQYKAEPARQIDPSDSMQIDRKEYEGIQNDVGSTNFGLDGYRDLSKQIVEALKQRDEALAEAKKWEGLYDALYDPIMFEVVEPESDIECLKRILKERDSLREQLAEIEATNLEHGRNVMAFDKKFSALQDENQSLISKMAVLNKKCLDAVITLQ